MNDIVVRSPVDNQHLKTIKPDDPSSVLKKINDAKTAQPSWTRVSVKERAQIMFSYRALLKKHIQELTTIIHQENGKTLNEAHAEVEKAIEVVEFACSMPSLLTEERLMVSRGVYCTMAYRPLGVVASITPFNFPLMIANWTTPIALTAGNAVILKPSPLVPLSALFMEKLLYEAGLPQGLFAVVNGSKETVDTLTSHDDIAAVSFVGSTTVAQKVYRDATHHLKRALCLGSAKNFLLVLPDADPLMTSENVVASAFGMAGQRCMAASAVITIKDCAHIVDGIVNKAQELKIRKDIAPIISQESKNRILVLIDEAIKEGAKLLLDGRDSSDSHNYLSPTILSDVKPHMNIAKTEVFGPVLSILNVDSVDEAIAIQQSSVYGNGASVYTQSGAVAEYLSERLTAGMIGVNIGVPVPREPFSFGGLKWSKFGAGDITGESSIAFWTNRVKQTTKWRREDAVNWMS